MAWMTLDGRRIELRHLEDDHLLACIERIKRKRPWRLAWLPVLEAEARRRWALYGVEESIHTENRPA